MHHPSENTLSPQEAIAALQWLAEAGVEDTIGDSPADWFAFDAAPPPPPVAKIISAPMASPKAEAPVAEAAPIYTSQGTAALIAAARAAADACTTLEELRDAVHAFEGCALKKLATNTLFADGNPDSGLMLIGDAPDSDDDREGTPFSGITGRLLDKMFAAIGRTR
ncbi:MAG: uracil-DNA glycosylase, partial [Alphaproteobacteria bacterium]|nr:uracil-DNA glycosylase [Alphaproteobacteria bacterium]